MNKTNFITAITALLFVPQCAAFAATSDPYTKEKKVSGHYNVTAASLLQVENSYGKVHVNTWDRNEITVDIVITTHAQSEARAQALLDKITIDEDGDGSGGGKIHYKTELHSINSKGGEEFSINYTINAPRKGALDLTNKYGDMYLGDFEGKLDINESYGALSTLKITAANPKIKVAFGSATISSIETGELNISYSRLSVDNAGDVTIKNSFGKTDIGTAGHLDIDQQYGDLEIESVKDIEGKVSFAGLEIGTLQKSADLELKYCGRADFKSVNAGVNSVKINSSFSTLLFSLAGGTNLDISVNSSFGDVTNKQASGLDLTDSNKKGYSNSHFYRGKTGSGNGRMNITASYGNITFK